jgi:hypothetical protein
MYYGTTAATGGRMSMAITSTSATVGPQIPDQCDVCGRDTEHFSTGLSLLIYEPLYLGCSIHYGSGESHLICPTCTVLWMNKHRDWSAGQWGTVEHSNAGTVVVTVGNSFNAMLKQMQREGIVDEAQRLVAEMVLARMAR